MECTQAKFSLVESPKPSTNLAIAQQYLILQLKQGRLLAYVDSPAWLMQLSANSMHSKQYVKNRRIFFFFF